MFVHFTKCRSNGWFGVCRENVAW